MLLGHKDYLIILKILKKLSLLTEFFDLVLFSVNFKPSWAVCVRGKAFFAKIFFSINYMDSLCSFALNSFFQCPFSAIFVVIGLVAVFGYFATDFHFIYCTLCLHWVVDKSYQQ